MHRYKLFLNIYTYVSLKQDSEQVTYRNRIVSLFAKNDDDASKRAVAIRELIQKKAMADRELFFLQNSTPVHKFSVEVTEAGLYREVG